MPVITDGKTTMFLLDNGVIGKIMNDTIMVNQIEGNNIDGSFGNIFLRIKKEDGYDIHPLIGPASQSHVSYTTNTVNWTGNYKGILYDLRLLIADNTWFWTVGLQSVSNQISVVDITYTQDLGLGEESFVKSNEAYASQYIDHFVQRTPESITIASRQNQSQTNNYPYLQEGSFQTLQSFSTDSLQFFGTNYKESQVPEGLQHVDLNNENLQYEGSYTALRTPEIAVKNQSTQVVFYASFHTTQPKNNTTVMIDDGLLKKQYLKAEVKGKTKQLSVVQTIVSFGRSENKYEFLGDELKKLFPDTIQVEKFQNQVLSFFNPDGSHVVLPTKERIQERLSGNIVLSNSTVNAGQPVFATTQYITGVFESHSVYGNTDMNQLSTSTRDAFNIFHLPGTRIYLKENGVYHILAMPSAFVMHYDGADWYYKLKDDIIKISDDSSVRKAQLNLSFESLTGKKYELLVSTQIESQTLGPDYQVTFLDKVVKILPNSHQKMAKKVPDLGYQIEFSKHNGTELVLGDENIIFNQPLEFPTNQVIGHYKDVSKLSIRTGLISDELETVNINKVRQQHTNNLMSLIRNIHFDTQKAAKKDLVTRTNLILPWFAHDALVHFLSPHGLEQYGGAAWGTRDVSQGPAELFLSTGHFDKVREIIFTTYTHQFIETGNWPQWFMFDEYSETYADESHGDVIVWPLKVIADYLLATGDLDILTLNIPYMSEKNRQATNSTETLLEHINRQIDYIENNFLSGTSVSAYGDGDWDDTLQPADSSQKKQMASTWTEELTIEVFRKLTKVLQKDSRLYQRCKSLVNQMYTDFQKYFMQSDVLPGFIKFTDTGEVQQIIYPGDRQTDIDYRLLPLSQGVLSKILTGNDADRAMQTIKDHLLYADGVRLMNVPAKYHGGVSKVFKRAEQSANFGREIGLLYVHAHIRYAQAVAVNGDKQEAWRLLDLVNPINLSNRVSNANIRQANVYFSSSDADFKTRYAAQKNYDQLASKQVKGGWRLYSSGPGIYIAAILQDIMGIKDLNLGSKHEISAAFDKEINITWD
ncbi:GH36-type glycosyl hydrolase domain-containing protein [Weissella paramesenteroides]|uniref:GH36-type glycosyl hydrolase domain-containing protein n=1 Tax=Weissella paramesenteroides TaxID=1249 RepID=UPI002E7ABFB0|nr:cellobiose phosphorylase [Weissella paramesenteroides]WPQ68721.1 cellobiose phosphorylase [Weissella paramesenteroides]